MITVTFDIETRKLAQDLPGGWDDLRAGKGGISCLVLYSSATERYHLFDTHNLKLAQQYLEDADLVLSFNGLRFDVPVLEGVLGRKLALKHHLDLLRLVWDAQNETAEVHKGNSLAELSVRTLGMAKNGQGELAPKLADEGRWAELMDYCMNDVHLTRSLFKYTQEHGGLPDIHGKLLELNLPQWFIEAKV